MTKLRKRIRHAAYVIAWAIVGNQHSKPSTHGRHGFGRY